MCITEPTIPDRLVLTGRIILTLLSVFVIGFGAKNVIKHYGEIKTYLTISIFYIFAFTTIVFVLWLAWSDICDWNTKRWQAINALLRTGEICFAWCQSLAFLLVARNLYEVKAMTNTNWTTYCAEKYTKTVNLFLIIGLIIFNLVLVIFMIALGLSADPTPADKENLFFVHLEIAFWFLGIFSAFTLISSTLYTSWVLRNLYGTDFRSTSYEILVVGGIFILAFTSRSVFEWVMFY